jgi:serine/threonine protein phosphatase 1
MLPDDTVIYAVGDVHGYADILDALHARIRADAQTRDVKRRVLIHLGDYVDRGPDSKGVLERLARDWPGWERADLMGNHEALMLDFVDDARDPEIWFRNGGLETMESYGVARHLSPGAQRQALTAALGEAGLAQLRALKTHHRIGGYFFAHAGVRPGVPLDAQSLQDLLWIREAFLAQEFDPGAVVVHGHTIRPEPQDFRHRIGIDLGVYRHFRLGAAVLHGKGREFLIVEDVVRQARS